MVWILPNFPITAASLLRNATKCLCLHVPIGSRHCMISMLALILLWAKEDYTAESRTPRGESEPQQVGEVHFTPGRRGMSERSYGFIRIRDPNCGEFPFIAFEACWCLLLLTLWCHVWRHWNVLPANREVYTVVGTSHTLSGASWRSCRPAV